MWQRSPHPAADDTQSSLILAPVISGKGSRYQLAQSYPPRPASHAMTAGDFDVESAIESCASSLPTCQCGSRAVGLPGSHLLYPLSRSSESLGVSQTSLPCPILLLFQYHPQSSRGGKGGIRRRRVQGGSDGTQATTKMPTTLSARCLLVIVHTDGIRPEFPDLFMLSNRLHLTLNLSLPLLHLRIPLLIFLKMLFCPVYDLLHRSVLFQKVKFRDSGLDSLMVFLVQFCFCCSRFCSGR